MRRLLLLAPLALAAPALAADRAVVVGIDAYPDLALDRPLAGAAADAERFAALLTGSMGFAPDAVTLLTDEAATAEAIMRAVIDGLVSGTAPGDRAVFYFAGLGARTADTAGTAKDVLLAHDAPAVLGTVPGDALAEILDLLDGRQATVVIDASFRGEAGTLPGTLATGRSLALGPGRAALGDTAAFGTGATPRAVWNAAAPDQFAWEQGDRGLFTGALLDGLAGAADGNGNGTISNAELLTFLRARAADWCSASADCAAAGGALIPVFEGAPQDPVLGPSRPEPAPAPTKTPQALPVSVDPGHAPGLSETMGFVTDLFAPSNAAGLTLAMSEDGALRLGQTVRFTATATRPGTLVLLDVNPLGELAQVFPSRLARTGTTRLAAGQTLTIPNGTGANAAPLEIRVTEPAGEGFLLALLVEDDLPRLTAILPENLDGGPIPNAGQYLYEIAQDLLRLQASGSGSAATQWSATYLPYRILP